MKKKILETFAHYVQDRGQAPNLQQLIREAHVEDAVFYGYFQNIGEVRKGLWAHFASETAARAQAEETYAGYSACQKTLSYCYTLLETLKPFRAYVRHELDRQPAFGTPGYMNAFRQAFEPFALEVLAEGLDTGEIASRPFISDQYKHVLWGLAQFTVLFWAKDDSPECEQTDVAVEKSVNFAFDCMAHGLLDSGFDLAKFLFQHAGSRWEAWRKERFGA